MGGDSGRYLGAVRGFLTGMPPTREALYYLAYEGMLLPIFALGGGTGTVVMVQCLLALAGAVGLYVLGNRLFSRSAGLFAAFLFLLHPSLQRWNFYLLTENLTTNALIAMATLSVSGERRTFGAILLGSVAVVLALSRPESFLFLLPFSVYFFLEKRAVSILLGAFLLLLVVGLSGLRPIQTSDFDLGRHWREGTYLWGYPGMGPPLGGVGSEPMSGRPAGWIQFLFEDPGWFVKLLSLRVFYYLSPTRPYYSTLHNATAVAFTLPIYALAVAGTFAGRSREIGLLWSLIALQGILVALTWSDWDNRWLDRVTPIFLLLAAGGIGDLRQRLSARIRRGASPAGP